MIESAIVFSVLVMGCLYEWKKDKFLDGKKTLLDWKIGAICLVAIGLVQRPLVKITTFLTLSFMLPESFKNSQSIEASYPILCVIVFLMVEEFLHGCGHKFSHSKTPKSPIKKFFHSLYRAGHRPHHLVGGSDGKGELTTTHTFVEGWTFFFLLPSIWFSFIVLYFGFVNTFLIGMTIKGIWSLHVHTNFEYDLYLLNHPNKFISKGFYALAHVFTFPNTHRHHHSRGPNSAKNLHNFLSLYDWLLYDTLVIEKERPKVIGWRQNEKEVDSAWYRFLKTR